MHDCHNPHGTVKPKQVRTSSSQDAVCFTCHTDKQGPFVFEHQPVKVDGCQSCHLVHGGPNPHMLKLSNVNLLCLQCHTHIQLQRGAGSAFVPQPGELLPVLRFVSLGRFTDRTSIPLSSNRRRITSFSVMEQASRPHRRQAWNRIFGRRREKP